MQILKWHNRLETGIERIDSEHKELLRLMNDCFESAMRGAGRGNLISRMNQIHEKLVQHFKTEEDIASSIGTRDFDVLKSQHDHMRDFLESTIPKLDSKDKTTNAQKIIVDVYHWYVNHVEQEDKKHFSRTQQPSLPV